MTTQLKSFLSTRKVACGSEFTHAALGLNKGSYYIPSDDEEEFLALYYDAMENGADLDIVERHRDQSPILIDLDFRQDTEARRYTDEMIVGFLSVLKEQIMEYTEAHDIKFFVLEKGIEARLDKKSGGYKDGIHVVCPDVVTKPEVQHIIRNNIIEKSMQGIFGDTFTNSYADIYDEAVIYRNGWFMFGSKKPDEEYPWVVTKVYNTDLEEIDNEHSDQELLSVLSIRNKFDCVAVKEGKLEEVKAYKEKTTKTTVTSATVVTVPSTLETISKMVMMLKPERADSHKEWIRWGMCLKGISEQCLPIWIEFSKQSPKFTEGECEKIWRTLAPRHIKEASLRMCARLDNPQAYHELMKDDIHNLIYASRSGTHTDIAKVVHHMYKDIYKCCYMKNAAVWYEFKNHHWEECPDAVTLKQRLSSEVFKAFYAEAGKYTAKVSETESETEQKVYVEIAKKLASVAIKLKNVSFKANIVKECQEVFHVSQKEFYDMLDENKGLLGFTNGVFDMDEGCFRDGLPDDMITLSTNLEFSLKDNVEYEKLINNFMWSMFEDDEMVQFMWDTLGYSAHGDKFLEFLCFWTGNGANGKTCFAKLIKNAYGDYYYEPHVSVFTTKKTSSSAANPELAKTKGKRFVLASEPEESDRFQIGALKNWSGNDRLQARELFKNPIEFDPQFLIGIMMNNLARLSDFDGGITRRLRIVHFPFKFVENPILSHERQGDTTLKNRFENDKGIAQQFMRMVLKNYMTRIKVTRKIHVPAKVMEVTNAYLEDNNTIKKFIDEHMEVDKDGIVLSTDVYNIYKTSEYYAQGHDQKWFASKMKGEGFPPTTHTLRSIKPEYHKCKVIYGLKVKPYQYMINEKVERDDELSN